MTYALAWLSENGWLYVGSFSGSMAATWTMRGLDIRGRIVAVVIGTLIGLVSGPPICEIWFKDLPASSRIPSFVCFVCGAVGLAVVPSLIKKATGLVQNYKIVAVEQSDE